MIAITNLAMNPTVQLITGEASGPTFVEEPEDVTIVRTKPAILKCKTEHALNAWFECNAGK